MDKNRINGAKDQAAGSVKEAIGKVTGDKRTEAEGKAQKAGGAAEQAAASAKDALRETAAKA